MNKIEEISGDLSPEMENYNRWMEYTDKLFQESTKQLLI
jgi:hypothetical protein